MRLASSMIGSGQRLPRASMSASASFTARSAPSAVAHPLRRHPAARPGSARRLRPSTPRGSETRMLPCVSAPIATSTWLGLEGGRGAGGAGGDREARAVELLEQRLAVDVQAGEGHQVGQPAPGRRRPPRRGPPAAARAQTVDQRAQPLGLRRLLRDHGLQRGGRRDDPGDVLEARHHAVPALVERAAGSATGPRCAPQAARPPRTAPLVRAGREHATSRRAVSRPMLWAASTSSGTPACWHPAPTAVDGLQGADLVVGGLQAGQRGGRPVAPPRTCPRRPGRCGRPPPGSARGRLRRRSCGARRWRRGSRHARRLTQPRGRRPGRAPEPAPPPRGGSLRYPTAGRTARRRVPPSWWASESRARSSS